MSVISKILSWPRRRKYRFLKDFDRWYFRKRHPGVAALLAQNQYGDYCVPISSMQRPAARTILGGGVWEEETIEKLLRHCRGGDVVQAGAYFGDFLPAVSKALDSKCKLWSFEPNPENFRCACATVAINGLANIVLDSAGLGSRKGNALLEVRNSIGRGLGGASMIVDRSAGPATNSVEISVKALDDVLPPERCISVIQLDLEGYEEQALEGALKTIKKWHPVLILETQPTETWFDRELQPLGYSVTDAIHDNTVYEAGKHSGIGS